MMPASKALLIAIRNFKNQKETIFRLERQLEEERRRSQRMSAGISDFEVSMKKLFTLK